VSGEDDWKRYVRDRTVLPVWDEGDSRGPSRVIDPAQNGEELRRGLARATSGLGAEL